MRSILLLLALAGCDGDAACASRYGHYELTGTRRISGTCDEATELGLLASLADQLTNLCVTPSQPCGDDYMVGGFMTMVTYGVDDRGIVDAVLTLWADTCTVSFDAQYTYVEPFCEPVPDAGLPDAPQFGSRRTIPQGSKRSGISP